MVSSFVREQKRYSQRDLCSILDCPEEKALPIIRKMKEYGILKVVKASDRQKEMSDLLEEDEEITDVEAGDNNYLYVFSFVGVVIVAGRVLKCYPKYLLHADSPLNELRQVLKVIEKYNSRKQTVWMFGDRDEDSPFNLLAVLLYLLSDYYENGIYNNTEEIIECNGNGEICWDKTINDAMVLIVNRRPYYTELQTRKRIDDNYDYFRRLHACILTLASSELREAGLLDLFEIMAVDLSDEEIDDFGEKDFILYQLEKELNTQFNTRKQQVLKAIYAYIDCGGSLQDTEGLSLFGTNSFNLVWQDVCANIMDNKLDICLGALQLPEKLKPGYDRDQKLIDIIEKPFWTAAGQTADDTLIPDIVAIEGEQFTIFDAKYYNARLVSGSAPKGQPGIESITKQYLYQLAYQTFICDHSFTSIKNCFLMPTENDKIIDCGEVFMEMFQGLGLESIKVRFLPADKAYSLYLSGRKLSISALNL